MFFYSKLLVALFLLLPNLGSAMPPITQIKNDFNCQVSINYEASNSELYAYTGYGEIICNDNYPMTIFSAVKGDSLKTLITKFTMNIDNFNVSPLASFFQDYSLSQGSKLLSLTSLKPSSHSQLNLINKVTLSSSLEINDNFIQQLTLRSFKIEQDDFFSFLEN